MGRCCAAGAARNKKTGKRRPWRCGATTSEGMFFCDEHAHIEKAISDIHRAGQEALEATAKDRGEDERATLIPVPVTEERVTLRGEILSTKNVDDPFRYNSFITKMLVRVETPEGAFKLWGTAPSVLAMRGVIKGFEIEFDAKIERSRDDESFGFFKRPTKVRVIQEATS